MVRGLAQHKSQIQKEPRLDVKHQALEGEVGVVDTLARVKQEEYILI